MHTVDSSNGVSRQCFIASYRFRGSLHWHCAGMAEGCSQVVLPLVIQTSPSLKCCKHTRGKLDFRQYRTLTLSSSSYSSFYYRGACHCHALLSGSVLVCCPGAKLQNLRYVRAVLSRIVWLELYFHHPAVCLAVSCLDESLIVALSGECVFRHCFFARSRRVTVVYEEGKTSLGSSQVPQLTTPEDGPGIKSRANKHNQTPPSQLVQPQAHTYPAYAT